MRFRRKSLTEMSGRISQLGMRSCLICGCDQIRVLKYPAIVYVGGERHDPSDPRWDPESNVLLMVTTVCEVCGNTQFFNSEGFIPGSEKALVVGLTEDEEAAQEGQIEEP
jgi:hypothetical protein